MISSVSVSGLTSLRNSSQNSCGTSGIVWLNCPMSWSLTIFPISPAPESSSSLRVRAGSCFSPGDWAPTVVRTNTAQNRATTVRVARGVACMMKPLVRCYTVGLDPHRVPRRLHFLRVEDEVRALRVVTRPVLAVVDDDALHVQRGLRAHDRQLAGVAAAVDAGVDVHVVGEVLDELIAVPGQQVDDATGQVAGFEDFAEGDRAQRAVG